MTVTFYSNTADNIVVDKTSSLTQLAELNNVTFKKDENKGTPQLELAYNSTIEPANYCYIQELGYYYNMSEPVLGAQRMIFDLSTDLLMSKKSEILNLGCIISRQENEYNTYLNDSRLPVESKQEITTVEFPEGFDDEHEEIIIVVNGGDYNVSNGE